jgi:tripartite-type tricarboxylate transporter receptor subunit TctC
MMRVLVVAAALLAWVISGSNAVAQAYPDRPVKLTVGFAVSGAMDSLSRLLADGLSKKLGQPFIVENKPGASGIVALDSLATSAPDGYNLLVLPLTSLVAYHLQGKEIELGKMIEPIGNVISGSTVVVVNEQLKDLTTFKDLVAYIRAHPGTAYSSAGAGSLGHLSMEMVAKAANLDMIHVPFRGAAPAMIELIAGRLAFMVADNTTAAPQIEAKKVFPVAVSGSTRQPAFPDVTTVAEQGFAGTEATQYIGLAAPFGTPRPIVDKLSAALKDLTADKDFRERAATFALDVDYLDGPTFKRTLSEAYVRWGQVIKDRNIKVQ